MLAAVSLAPRCWSLAPAPSAGAIPALDTFAHRPLELVGRRDPVLRNPATVQDLLAAISARMRQSGGVGLAAPQVGIPYRMIVVNAGDGELRLVNPIIESRSGITPSLEGCLSLPGAMGVVWRSAHVVVKAQDAQGKDVTIDARGLKARCLQHEIDHLDGRLFTDRAFLTPLHAAAALVGGIAGHAVAGQGGAIVGAATGYAAVWGVQRLRARGR